MNQTSENRTAPMRAARYVSSRMGRSKALFFLAAGISLVASVGFYFTGDPQRGIFVGIWVPSILSAGTLLMAGHSHE